VMAWLNVELMKNFQQRESDRVLPSN